MEHREGFSKSVGGSIRVCEEIAIAGIGGRGKRLVFTWGLLPRT